MTGTPPPIAPPSHPASPQKTSGLAVAALVLGICGIVPCLGVLLGGVGILLGILALAGNAGGKGFAITGIVAGLVCIVIGQVLLLVPALNHTTEQDKRAVCGGRLHAIAKGIATYGAENQDAFPPDLDVLVRQRLVARKMLQCPSAGRNRQCDYFYLAPLGKGEAVPGDVIVACDFKDNHGGEGRTVLHASLLSKWILEDAFQAELAKPVNAAFAAALRKAEGEVQRGN